MLNAMFYISAAVAVLGSALAVSRRHAVHALLYFIVSLLALALIFFLLGAPFAAALEVIIYAGAIMVLFLFVVMFLNLGPADGSGLEEGLRFSGWIVPGILAAVLLIELLWILGSGPGLPASTLQAGPAPDLNLGPQVVARAMFGPYVLAVELASFMLLAGLVAAFHLARPEASSQGVIR
jgi:NADH-quinone oxidoreductase subunit J